VLDAGERLRHDKSCQALRRRSWVSQEVRRWRMFAEQQAPHLVQVVQAVTGQVLTGRVSIAVPARPSSGQCCEVEAQST